MVRYRFLQSIVVSGITLGSISLLSQPSAAQNKFFCGLSDNKPATVIRTSQGNIPLIYWSDPSLPPSWVPQERCQELSSRFQQFYDKGKLKYITTAWAGNPILCLAGYKGEGCLPNSVLATLNPGTSANLTVLRMLNLDAFAGVQKPNGHTVTGKAGLISEANDSVYINVDGFLNRLEQTSSGYSTVPQTPYRSP